MRKTIRWVVVLLVGYIGAGLFVGLCLSPRIERNRKGVALAFSALVADQLRCTDRLLEITGRTLDVGRSMPDEMRDILADRDLNQIAIAYTGEDWSNERSDFLEIAFLCEEDIYRIIGHLRLVKLFFNITAIKKLSFSFLSVLLDNLIELADDNLSDFSL